MATLRLWFNAMKSHSEVSMEQSFDNVHFEKRLKLVETQNRQLKLFVLILSLMMASLLLVTCRNEQSSIVKAQQFVLIDSNGQPRGGLTIGPEGPALELYDSHKTLRATLSLFHDMPNLTLKDSSGIGRLVVGIVPSGPGMMLYDDLGQPRAQFDVGKEGPRLYLEDQQGFSATVGNFLTSDPALNNKLGAASLVLHNKFLGVIWHAP
jgi:hypothetical protein